MTYEEFLIKKLNNPNFKKSWDDFDDNVFLEEKNNYEKCCELYKMIPQSVLDKLWDDNYLVDLDYTFLGFEEVYRGVTQFVPKDKVIIDLGCAYGTQSYYFVAYKQYIGVDLRVLSPVKTDNSTYYIGITIQDFINKIFTTLNLDKEDVFAICSYVPDVEARELVAQTFPYHLVYYPSGKPTEKLKKTKEIY